MKYIMSFVFLISGTVQGYQCDHFSDDYLKMEALEFISKEIYRYKDSAEFCEKEEFLDLQLYNTPNYFKHREENDDHYKLMVHYSYKSCTFIYNRTRKSISKKSCYSTW
ncbi:MAG: hypothetical protein AB8E15_00815 [Bdellovibrionales bacterium]